MTLERETLHIMDDKQRIALIETRTQGNLPSLPQLIRFQYGNHLGSASLELDDQAQIISYEEYFPYGSTSYQAVGSQTETAKRYRYTGKERDKETGLEYHSARYYLPWLGRWTSADPIGIKDGVNVYGYVKSNPINTIDIDGMQSGEHSKSQSEKTKPSKIVLDPQYQKQEEIKAERFPKVPEKLNPTNQSSNEPIPLTPYNPQDETIRHVTIKELYIKAPTPAPAPAPEIKAGTPAPPISLSALKTSAGNVFTPPPLRTASNDPPIPAPTGKVQLALGVEVKEAKLSVDTKGNVSGGYGPLNLRKGGFDLYFGSYSTETQDTTIVKPHNIYGTILHSHTHYEQTTQAIGLGLSFEAISLQFINSQTELRINGPVDKRWQQHGLAFSIGIKKTWFSLEFEMFAPPRLVFQRPH